VLAIAILTSLVPFYELCGAMAALRIPQALVMQIHFLYRYLFVLVEESQSMQKARDMRAFDGKGKGIKDTSKLLGTLFLRTLDRSQRIYRAMVSRGFTGRIPIRTNSRFGLKETAFTILSLGLLTGLYIFPF
jgi:cobalt/nickel transport system permease protein